MTTQEYYAARNAGVRWTTTVIAVNIETGEIIDRYYKEKKQYLTIKITKHVKINEQKTRGVIEYTKLVRRNPQTRLW